MSEHVEKIIIIEAYGTLWKLQDGNPSSALEIL
jgi:hypothetical protein